MRVAPALRVRPGRHRGPRGGRRLVRASTGPTARRQPRRRDPRRPLDRRPAGVRRRPTWSGTFELLDAARRHLATLEPERRARFRFLHVSTDEVYGSLGPTGAVHRGRRPYAPNSPYAASKAAADHLVRAYHETYGLPALITNCSNNYGPYQFPEKLIPLMILNALEGGRCRSTATAGTCATGSTSRTTARRSSWCCGAARRASRYNVGGGDERTNLEIVDAICAALESLRPAAANPALAARGLARYGDLRTFVPDRPGHDRRYAVDATRLGTELGWRPAHRSRTGSRHRRLVPRAPRLVRHGARREVRPRAPRPRRGEVGARAERLQPLAAVCRGTGRCADPRASDVRFHWAILLTCAYNLGLT